MIRLAKYKQQQLAIIKSPSSKSKLGKYLSPVQQAEAEYKASKRSGVFKGSNGFYKRGNMSNISVATSITSPSGPEASRLTMTSNSNFDEDGIELAITMEGLIEDFFRTTLIDDDHIPTRVHLGILHLECGNDYLSEHWLERAMKRGKSRGAGGGKSGLTTYYGGHSSRLGWEAWRTLGKIKAKTDRLDQAKECMFYAVALEQCSPARGLECLGRLITSQREW